ncbi:hypothetical protein CerSpe_182360 [Prunus speciosa]
MIVNNQQRHMIQLSMISNVLCMSTLELVPWYSQFSHLQLERTHVPSTHSDIKPLFFCIDCLWWSCWDIGTIVGTEVMVSEEQTIFHFCSCSVLMVYEKESILQGRNSGAEIKLIDFAHVIEGKGVIDHNFLGGLCSLIKLISDIVTSPSA